MAAAINKTNLILMSSILIPLLGCIMVIQFDNAIWFILLAPLIIYMEGGLLLIGLAILITSFFMN